MTLSECLAQVESLKHNTVPEAMKLVWLTELDQRVIIDVLNTHALSVEEQAEADGFTPYTSESDDSIILLIPDPFSEIYRYWLMARIDEVNRDSAYTGRCYLWSICNSLCFICCRLCRPGFIIRWNGISYLDQWNIINRFR